MRDRSIDLMTGPQPQTGGLLRLCRTAELRHVDPFVFLDLAPREHVGDGCNVVPPHTHRGAQPGGLVRDDLDIHPALSLPVVGPELPQLSAHRVIDLSSHNKKATAP